MAGSEDLVTFLSQTKCKSLRILVVVNCSLSFLMYLQYIKISVYHLFVNEKNSCFSRCLPSLNTISVIDKTQQDSAFCMLLFLKSFRKFGIKFLHMSSVKWQHCVVVGFFGGAILY